MQLDRANQVKSIHRLAFEHYLRTGERLTDAQWFARNERKFNPYHDELGRFTSPPGVTVSYGKQGPPGDRTDAVRHPNAARPKVAPEETRRRTDVDQKPSPPAAAGQGSDGKAPIGPNESVNGFSSDLVRSAVSAETDDADSYWELNRRLTLLNRLRSEAGPSPSAAIRADLDDFQRRIDANRVLLDERYRIADRELTEILRAGLAPYDVAAGAATILSGEGEVRDYLSVVGVVPITGTLGKIGRGVAGASRPLVTEVVQLGGSYSVVRKLRGYHAHHIPGDKVSPLSRGRGPAIAMLPDDHRATLSYGRGSAAKAHRKAQAALIAKGDFRGAQRLDIDDIRKQFGSRYDDALTQLEKYTDEKGF